MKLFNSRGVVAVTMDLLKLDINQCPDKYYVNNLFKGTHKCDERTSYVSIHKLWRVHFKSYFIFTYILVKNKTNT